MTNFARDLSKKIRVIAGGQGLYVSEYSNSEGDFSFVVLARTIGVSEEKLTSYFSSPDKERIAQYNRFAPKRHFTAEIDRSMKGG
jgi:hypothetical protein